MIDIITFYIKGKQRFNHRFPLIHLLMMSQELSRLLLSLQGVYLIHNTDWDAQYYQSSLCFEDESLQNALYMLVGNVCCERALKFHLH